MPFDLKNAEATYQHMMSRMFKPRLGKTMEVYIDNKLVNLESRNDHLTHMREAFQLMRLHHLRLNLDKCAFEVKSGKFLDIFVSKHGIRMTLKQARAVLQMQPPIIRKHV